MASFIRRPKRQLSIPSTGQGGKRSRTNSPSRAAPNTGVAHPQNIDQSTGDSSNPLLGGESEPSVPNISIRHNEGTALAPQGMAQGLPVAPTRSTPNCNATEGSWVGLEKVLAALHITTKICPPLYSAIEGLKSCLHVFEEAAKSHRDYKELATGLTAMVELLIKHMPIAASREMTEVLKGIAKKIEEELKSIDKRQCPTGPSRILRASKEDEDLVRRYRRIEQLFRQLQAEASMSTWDITKRHHVDTQLEKLGPVKLANYNSKISMDIGRRSCTENTRTKILSDSMQWADDPDGAKIYWLNGMAGTGKTTIGYSLCERLEAAGQLAASFFCTRTSRECGEAKQIVPTIAYQLARRLAPFRDALCKILDNNPDIGTLNTTSQFDSLLAKPLAESREFMERNLVIVIDALDECSDPHAVKIVLDILFRYAAALPVKFFVTSRPEPIIRNSMMIGITESNRAQSILYLHEIEKSLVQADIELYLRDELKHMLPTHCADIEDLAEQAGNLFIYAATAVRYIRPGGKAVNSKQRLKTILEVNNKSKKSMSDIDLLYSAILSAAIGDDELEPEEQESIRTVLWTAICACEPVLIDTLATLCELDDTDLAVDALQPLRSVLHVSDHNNLVTTLHASFPDFMFSEERSKQFFCNRPSHDGFLAKRCLAIMKSQLRFNICQIESSFLVDDEIVDLEKRAQRNISKELFYASRFWADHLSQGEDSSSSPVMEMVHEFLSQQLLFWMEVLNLKKCMVAGAVASTKVHMWLRNLHAPSDIVLLASDAQTFVGNYAAHQVSTSTSHIYISALPLSSPTSLIRRIYWPRFTGLVQATGTLMDQIDPVSLAVWTLDYPIRSASFSGDRKYIAIGDDNGKISVRHSHSGKSLITFQAHREVISFVSFSSDAALIASSSHDHTVCIWKVSDGSLAFKPFRGHTDRVNSIAFSPHGMYLASGSDDTTVRIWTTRGPSYCQSILAGHISAVRSVMFSPDGMLIISGSNDHTVCVWDAPSGKLLRTLRGHTGSISCVRFSPCGTFIVSSSLDRTIRIWDTQSGASIGNPFLGHANLITSIAVSPEGERIVSGSLDHKVIVWHRRSGEVMAGPFEGHTGSVRSVQFSADGAWIVSASEDRTVRIWHAQGKNRPYSTATPKLATPKTTFNVSVAVSPDGSYIAYGKPNGMIWVWDSRHAVQVAESPRLATNASKILLITISPDNKFVFVVYANGRVETLDMQLGQFVGPPHCFFHSLFPSRPLALSPDGTISCNSRVSKDPHSVELWSIHSNQVNCVMSPHDKLDTFLQAVFSSNSTRLATGTERGIIDLWDAQSGEHIAGPFHPGIYATLKSIDISHDGTQLVSVRNDESPRLLDMTDGACTMLPGPTCNKTSKFSCLRFSPNAAHIAFLTQVSGQHGQGYVLCDIPHPSEGSSGYRTEVVGDLPPEGTALGFLSNKPFAAFTFRENDGTREMTLPLRMDKSDIPYTSTSDGWFLDGNSKKTIWVPPEIGSSFLKQTGVELAEDYVIAVNYDEMLVGEKWSKCYIGE